MVFASTTTSMALVLMLGQVNAYPGEPSKPSTPTTTSNCGAHCKDSWDCGSQMGPCNTCHMGTCRPPPAPSLKANLSTPHNQGIKSSLGCYAQYCSDDIDCQGMHGQGCGTCSPPIHPIEFGICIPPASSSNRASELAKSNVAREREASCVPEFNGCDPSSGPACCAGLRCTAKSIYHECLRSEPAEEAAKPAATTVAKAQVSCQPANADCNPNAGPGIQGDCCQGLSCDPSGWGSFVCG